MEWRTPQGYFQLSEDGRYSVEASKVQGKWRYTAWRTPRHENPGPAQRIDLGCFDTPEEAQKCAEADDA